MTVPVSNTSPLTNLAAIGQFDLLRDLYGGLLVAETVWEELNARGRAWPGCDEAAAQADLDARPMTEAELPKARRMPRVKTMRRALGLTQEEFAARYRVPLGTLRDGEQGRTEPDQPVKAYLTVIAHNPEGVDGRC